MMSGDVVKWAWSGEPFKDLFTGIAGIVAIVRERTRAPSRIDVPPMSGAWLREHERQAAKHSEY